MHGDQVFLSGCITMTSWWARWRLKSPASRLFTQPSIQAQIKENIKTPRHWPLCGEFTGDRWIPRTNGQSRCRLVRNTYWQTLVLSALSGNLVMQNIPVGSSWDSMESQKLNLLCHPESLLITFLFVSFSRLKYCFIFANTIILSLSIDVVLTLSIVIDVFSTSMIGLGTYPLRAAIHGGRNGSDVMRL